MLIIYGECGNEVNPHALLSRAFQQRFYINLNGEFFNAELSNLLEDIPHLFCAIG
jgi:hypothetical protein